MPFLLVGRATEPNIFMDRASVNFKSLIVGRQLRETVRLINNEKIPFSFSFSETSFELGADGTPVVKFTPTTGTVGPMSDIPIDITFSPLSEKIYNFNLVRSRSAREEQASKMKTKPKNQSPTSPQICNIKKKPTPVTVNVKGEGYEIHESLQSEQQDGAVFQLASGTSAENVIDFGQVQMNDKRVKRVTIINSGKFNFDFSWKFLSKVGGNVSIVPEIGTVGKGERVVCDVVYMPTNTSSLKNVKAICQIGNGSVFPITVLGSGIQPLLKFSKKHHDFGTQFLYRVGMKAESVSIVIQNDDIKEVSIDVIAPESPIFEVQRGAGTLAPGSSTTLDVLFYPREAIAYTEVIRVDINGLSSEDIVLTGEGTPFKVELVQPDLMRTLNLGAVRVGHTVAKTAKLINKSTIPVKFNLGPIATIETLANHAVTISPLGECVLRPKGLMTIDVKFDPHQRIPPFYEEVFLEAPGMNKPLFVLQGACQGIEIKLENDTLPFGAVVQKSSTVRRLQLQNTGDIGAKFHWNASKFKPDFNITPSEGYISPGMDIPLEITFHPLDINPDIRYENIICNVEGTHPLYLTLTGMCVSQPPQSEAVKFNTPVRQPETKGIPLTNKTTSTWHIHPVIENDYWSGPDIIDIEPGQTKSYDIQFMPLEMSPDGARHEGSIFFPLPDGTGLLYKLFGVADKPVSSGTINREIPCKTTYTEVLLIPNWLKRTQRFKVIMEVAKPDPSVVLKGYEFIDVPALYNREYKLNFYAYREGVTNVKIIFKNELSQEFIFFNLTFKSTPPGVISTLEMVTVARQAITKDITIMNPLVVPVTFSTSCNHPEVTIPHSFTIQPK